MDSILSRLLNCDAALLRHSTPLLRHRMIAQTDCDILEASTPELDDVVRLEDRYGRVK